VVDAVAVPITNVIFWVAVAVAAPVGDEAVTVAVAAEGVVVVGGVVTLVVTVAVAEGVDGLAMVAAVGGIGVVGGATVASTMARISSAPPTRRGEALSWSFSMFSFVVCLSMRVLYALLSATVVE